MKRHNPYLRPLSEQRADSRRHYAGYISHPGKISNIFTERPHYDLEGKK